MARGGGAGGAAGAAGARQQPPPPQPGATNAPGQHASKRHNEGDIADPKTKPKSDTGSFRNQLVKEGKAEAAGVLANAGGNFLNRWMDKALEPYLPKPQTPTEEIQ